MLVDEPQEMKVNPARKGMAMNRDAVQKNKNSKNLSKRQIIMIINYESSFKINRLLEFITEQKIFFRNQFYLQI